MPDDLQAMQRALELAARGEGFVEPNPMVGCVIVAEDQVVGEGWHRRYGGPHAEVEALRQAGSKATGATLYVTLEPCCHYGKTPPCSQAVLDAGVRRVVVAHPDPFPEVSGGGLEQLRAAGVAVEVGLAQQQAADLMAPYLQLVTKGRPWIIAKWAMTLDGKLATTAGDSRWISGDASRSLVHSIRGRVDAVLVGRETARCDNPQLTARPPGPRVATRIVLDTDAQLTPDSHLAQTAHDAPVLIATGETAPAERCERLAALGCEILPCPGETPAERIAAMLEELGRRRMTNILVEGGGQVLGTLLDAGYIDEVHAFIAAKLVGGATAPSPVAGRGIERMADALQLVEPRLTAIGDDVHIFGRVRRAD